MPFHEGAGADCPGILINWKYLLNRCTFVWGLVNKAIDPDDIEINELLLEKVGKVAKIGEASGFVEGEDSQG